MSKTSDNIAITGMGSISPLGYSPDEVWQSYLRRESLLKPRAFNGEKLAAGSLLKPSEDILKSIRLEETYHRHLDRSVLMAMHCAREAVEQAGWEHTDGTSRTGVNIGSSRGATGILEDAHREYMKDPSERLSPVTSPTTTLGNVSSTVAHDIGTSGPEFSHSVTCSSALHSVFNAIAWMRAGLADRFIVGGTEAPLTGFTVAQMKALRIYTNETHTEYPSRPCSAEVPLHDMMALGEGAALFALEKLSDSAMKGRERPALGVIDSFGYGLESPPTAASITEDGLALRQAMNMALKGMATQSPVDMIVLHAPGTIKGDRSELNAIRIVFGDDLPVLVSNKWFIGHTFGASAALSLEYALLILAGDDYIDFPYPVHFENRRRPIRKIMINAAGFGGNAASLIVSKPAK
jgi:3-oxoacyl-[acyl-carrier-protein] synthase II